MTVLDRQPAETFQDNGIPVLGTERLILRAPRPGDASTLATLLNDLRIAANLSSVPHPYTFADAEKFIASANTAADAASFVITARDGRLLGSCGVGSRNGGPPEIGYWLAVGCWGKGYATEAARAVLDYGFLELGFDVIRGAARVNNPASRRVLEKCGFQWVGVELIRIRALNSAGPADRFRLDRGLWASLKSWGRISSIPAKRREDVEPA
jgi:RimJ/RimL family protein N-acetyltransferase